MTRLTMTIAGLLSATAIAFSVGGAAQAADFEFRYKAHEIETVQGRADLMRRLERAAQTHCGVHLRNWPMMRREAVACSKSLVFSVASQIDRNSGIALARKED